MNNGKLMTSVMGQLSSAAGSTQRDLDRILGGTQAKIDKMSTSWDRLIRNIGGASSTVANPAMDIINTDLESRQAYDDGLSRYEAQGGTKAEAQAEFNRRYGEANPDFSWYNPADLYVREQDFFRSMGAYGRDETTTPFQGYENERQVQQNAKMPLAEQYRQYGAGKMRPTLDGIEVNRGLPTPTARPGAETPAGLEASHNGIPVPAGRPLPVEIVNSGLSVADQLGMYGQGRLAGEKAAEALRQKTGWQAPTEGQALTLPSTAAEMDAFHAAMEQPVPAKQVFPDLVYPVAPPMDLMPPRRDMTRPGEGAALTLQSDFDTGRFGISPAADDGRGTDALRDALLQGRRGEPASTDDGRGTDALRSALAGGTITTSIDALISSQERLTAAMASTADRFTHEPLAPEIAPTFEASPTRFPEVAYPVAPPPNLTPPQRDMTRPGEGAALSLQTVTDGADALRRAMEDGGSTLKISGADAGSSIQSSGTTAAQAILSAAQALERAASSSIGENGRAAAAAISNARSPQSPTAVGGKAALPRANRAPATTMSDAGSAGGG